MDKVKYTVLTILGAVLCIAPPVVATFMYFPLWVATSSSATVSGLSLILILVSIIPIIRIVKKIIETPSIPIVWAIICVFCFAFKSIIDQVLVISFVGTLSSLAGMFIFWLRKKGAKEEKE